VARTALLGGDEQLFRAREALAQVLGLQGQAGVASTFDVRGLVDDVGGSCSVVAHSERDDVVAARKAAQQARGSRDQTLWGYAPRFDLTTSAAALTSDHASSTPASW
jgi:outer membrane protein TolC